MRDDPALVIHNLAAELGRAADLLLGEKHGISFARYRVLRGLRRDGATTQHALAESLGIGDASISRVLPALVERGWCLVEDDPHHGRRRRVRLTPDGADLERVCATALAEAFYGATSDAGIDADRLFAAAEALTARLRSATASAADR
ncbi:MarR family transcriptional regulator [Actinokineospora sp. PR83]|uniref:MarR family winged helix-turn-helix transcriptional regulator n=1 Tax=Actinokineospora sp. PR83 TaxID=2884908 RepID=UPI0027E0372E|nr:MarR family transcriptional regulator [Actinokineospora sp. PR83]MCG8914494.1 MarR family transcriptional regulator [Actinokineospora sp. PR83]